MRVITGAQIMLNVKAATDIYSAGGLLIAIKGTEGQALPQPKPRHNDQFGKALVKFANRNRAYWCKPGDLRGLRVELYDEYLARKSLHDPFIDVLKVPN